MQSVIAFSCLLAVASAGYLNHGAVAGVYGGALGYANHGSHAVAYNAPLVHAAHPVHVGYAGPLAHAYAAHTGPIAHGYAHAAPLAHGYAHGYAHAAPLASQARLVDPVAIAAGAPLPTGDTVEVAAAKAAHFAAHANAKSLAHAAPVVHAVAAPVAHAYAAPLAHGFAHGYGHAGHFASEARLVDPVAIAAGAPLPTGDTVEVAAAKAFHHQAHVAAKHGHFLAKRSPGYLHAAVAAPLAYAVAAPAHSYSYSHQVHHAPALSYAAPLAYAGHYGHGYGLLGAHHVY